MIVVSIERFKCQCDQIHKNIFVIIQHIESIQIIIRYYPIKCAFNSYQKKKKVDSELSLLKKIVSKSPIWFG